LSGVEGNLLLEVEQKRCHSEAAEAHAERANPNEEPMHFGSATAALPRILYKGFQKTADECQ
jgi:hypothetical protein